MSNMGHFGNNKNPPWARGANAPAGMVGQANPLQQQMGITGMVQYQQSQQVFQAPMGLQQQNMGMGLQQIGSPNVSMNPGLGQQLNPNQLFSQVGAVTYPNPRALNPTAFQQPNLTSVTPVQNSPQNSTKQRVFTGTVTKVHDNFGFVDEDVFFQTTACVKGSNPIVGDRVLVEASFNPNMPFKWNATRIQVLPMSSNPLPNSRNSNQPKSFNSVSSGYNAVPPPMENTNGNYMPQGRNNQRSSKSSVGGRSRERSRDRERDDDEIERKRRREDRTREREEKDKKSPLRRRSRSPKSRRRTRIVPRYMVQIPKIALHLPEADVLEIRRRYTNLYVPSDFFSTQFRWIDAFPPHSPFALNKPCSFHIMSKDIESVSENDAVLEPPDADYLFSAKVMLMSVPPLEELYTKCCTAEDPLEERDFVHPTRLINFLVGLRGKNETMAIGGPWSPSMDGADPKRDPSVLIRTAIRSCKALTGIDLSACTQWYRFVELYYRRCEHGRGRKPCGAPRVETVVLFVPDVWSCQPTRLEWDLLQQGYRRRLERQLAEDTDKEEEPVPEGRLEPTHHSQLDPRAMGVPALRTELKARGVSSKGLKSQLVARLTKALKNEVEKTEDDSMETDQTEKGDSEEKEEKKKEAEEKKLDEKEKQQLEKKYTLPDEQHIIVHPSKVAKSGKFDCTVMSLSLLLDYRPEDTKEHSFEVSLFAELFNEMLMRDFGFNIYKAIYNHPEKAKDVKDEKKKKDDDKKGDKKEDKPKKEEIEEEGEEIEEEEDEEKKEKTTEKKSDRKSSDREKKKKERTRLVTKDKNLLLSFVYFDQTHCGYIFEKDIEDLIYTLGLALSRAQVRKLVAKVVTRDSLHYRRLTDRPKDEEIVAEEPAEPETSPEELAFGNKRLLPIFKTDGSGEKDDSESSHAEGFVMYQGAMMDVGKLINQLNRSEKARVDTENRMIELKKENTKLTDKNDKSSNTIKNLSSDLSDCKKKLQNCDDALLKITTCSNLYYSALVEIKDKIEPILSTNCSENSEVKKENHESRWESDLKIETKTEPTD